MEEENAAPVEQAPEESAPIEEKSPLEVLLDEIDALKARVAHLESMAHNSHSIPPETVNEIAAHSIRSINDHLRNLFNRNKG